MILDDNRVVKIIMKTQQMVAFLACKTLELDIETLLQSPFNKKVADQIEKWFKGQISGERCAMAVVDAAGDALPVAGAVVGYTAGMAAGAAVGPVGIVVGGLSGAAVGGLAGQAVNRVIQVLR